MEYIYPRKLKKGDKIMIIAPARSFKILSEETIKIAKERLESLGFEVVFGKHISECDEFLTSSIESRLEDLHEAFKDDSIAAIFSVIGGSSTNQIVDYIDYELIKANPKIICGFSDITVLHNAILSKTGVVTYYGPHFSSWGMKYGFDYSLEYFKKCCMESESFDIVDSGEWSDDARYLDQEKRIFEHNEGTVILQEGTCTGRIIGGNVECICVSMGTPYLPILNEDTILFIEQDAEGNILRFIRRLEQILQSDFSRHITGIVIGKFQKGNNISIEQLKKIVRNQKRLKGIPIVANINFGHTTPIATFPLGGVCTLHADSTGARISIIEH